MNVQLVVATETDWKQLTSLLKTYIAEMIQYVNESDVDDVTQRLINELENYKAEENRWPYLITSDSAVAGFCFLRYFPQEPGTYDIDQFFVLKDFRRTGIGSACLAKLIALHPGKWLIRVLKTNEGALAFWLRAVAACAGEDYERSLAIDNGTEKHFIRFDTATL